MREERWLDFVSPEAEKISAIQTTTGNQYFAKTRSFDTAHSKPVYSTLCNAKMIAFKNEHIRHGESPGDGQAASGSWKMGIERASIGIRGSARPFRTGIRLTLALYRSLLCRVRFNSCSRK